MLAAMQGMRGMTGMVMPTPYLVGFSVWYDCFHGKLDVSGLTTFIVDNGPGALTLAQTTSGNKPTGFPGGIQDVTADYMFKTDNAALNPGTGDFSVIVASQSPATGTHVICGTRNQGAVGTQAGWWIRWNNNIPAMIIDDGAGKSKLHQYGGTLIPGGTWTSFGFSWDNSENALLCYINGNLLVPTAVSNDDMTGSDIDSGNQFRVCQAADGNQALGTKMVTPIWEAAVWTANDFKALHNYLAGGAFAIA